MALINIYLKETPLTSTKNIYIEENRSLNEGLDVEILLKKAYKRKGLFSQLHDLSDKNILVSTENKFLSEVPLSKKKKKKKCAKSVEHSRELEREVFPEDEELLGNSRKRYCASRVKKHCFRTEKFLRCANTVDYQSSGPVLQLDELGIQEQCDFHFGSAPAQDVAYGFPVSDTFPVGSAPAPMVAPATAFGFAGKRATLFSDVRFGGVQVATSTDSTATNIPEPVIFGMPSYKLDDHHYQEESEIEFFPSSVNFDYFHEKSTYNIKSKKLKLLNIVSMALMYSSNLRDRNDSYRIVLLNAADDVRLIDPEFVLKIALYARQELHVRTVTNFLLSYAAIHHNTRLFLEKYFSASIVLPTDWIEVAEYFQVLNDESEKQPFSAALRRAMKKAFLKFDEYQLAKYNRDKIKKKYVVEDDENCAEELDKCASAVKKFTLKKLIRILHIDSPAEHVMCLLGKKYPVDHNSFRSCGLPGSWDPNKAGKRMKLPVPETWETQISSRGNTSDVWESLIDNNKLPYMAMLRNLKNLILSNISEAHHKKVLNRLENKKHVINSRQLPLQFFEAYKAVSGLSDLERAYHYYCTSGIRYLSIPSWKKTRTKKTVDKLRNVSVDVLAQYMDAISKAVEISSMNNLHPIPGKTLIILEIGHSNEASNKKIYETCIMTGLMCLKACEDCKMNVICNSLEPEEVLICDSDSFLSVVSSTCEAYKQKQLVGSDFDGTVNIFALKKVLYYYLKPRSILSVKLHHIVFLRCSSDDENCSMENAMTSFLQKYRQIVNSDLLYTNINFSLSNKSFSETSSSGKDMYLCGASSSLIKFIAERSSGGQLTYVENIDVKHNLPELKNAAEVTNNFPEAVTNVPMNYKVPKWHTLRIFISSTFKDMLSERDLLIRYVIPELRKRAASVFVKIAEIDLRWGITESDSSTKRAAELCLTEAQKSDIFVGIIGDRYGTIYNFDDPPDAPDLDWVEECLPGLSITELEIHAAALRNPDLAKKKAFFYFRDNSFLSHVPQKWRSHFSSEDFNCLAKVGELKAKIKSNNFNVLDGYPCHFAGIFENKPILAGLDVLGAKMLEDLWKAVQAAHTADPYFDDVSEEEMCHQNVMDSHSFFIESKNSCMDTVLKRIKRESGVFVICGATGSGKTTFMVNLLKNLKNCIVVKFFIGFSPKSRNLSYMIQYICNYFCLQLPVSVMLPDLPDDVLNQFPDILLEAASCTGGKELILLIDGLEHLESNDQRLDWLPLILPNRVKVVCSTSDSSLAFKVLSERQARGNSIFIESLSPFQQSDREAFVRNYLQYYKKTLDESAFGNSMLKIVTKKESSNPFYLRVVCDYLRIFATFNNLLSMLEKLPSTALLLLQEVILQIENEFGSSFVQSAFSLLCITNEGLEDDDIYQILSFLTSADGKKSLLTFKELKENIMSVKPEDLLSQVKYCSLMHIISAFANGQGRRKSFTLRGTQFEKSIQKFYLNKNYVSHCKYLHHVLSAYYHNICDPDNDDMYNGHSAFAIRGLLYHMLHGCLYHELSNLLCNCKFIEAVFREKTDDLILDYYSSLLYDIIPTIPKISREISHHHLYSFYDFVSRNFHIFHRYPCLVMQQALNEPPSSSVSLKSEECHYYSLENLTRSLVSNHRLTTIGGFIKNITASASEKIRPFVILGSEDGYLKLLDLNARKIVRNIKSHVSAITCICYAGKDRLCVSSVDGTLTLWDASDFSQIAVLKGHTHNVTSCCADPSGCILLSSGWDNSVRLWSLVDGRSISVIDDFRCPVNCIDHHPLKQQVACGLWNGSIEIWDTVSMERICSFSNTSGSVKSIAYTPDGFNIISSFLKSEVCIWSSEEGLKISSLKGHVLPVTVISYSFAESVFVSGSDDCTLKVWSSVAEPYFCIISESKFCPVSHMEFLSENYLAVSFQNSEIWIFDINSGNSTSKIKLDMDVLSSFSTYSEVNIKSSNSETNWFETSLVFGTNAGKLMVGNIYTSTTSLVAELTSKITSVVHNHSFIICGSAEGDIGVYSYPDNILSKTVSAAHRGFVTSLCFCHSNENLYALSTSNDNVLKLWKIDMKNLNVILQKELFSKHRDSITCSIFHPSVYNEDITGLELKNLFTGSYDNEIICYTHESTNFKGLQSSVLKIACSDNFVLGCGNDGSLILWSMNGKVLTSVPGIELSSTPLSFYVTESEAKKFVVTFAYVDKDGSIKLKKPFERAYSCSFEGHRKAITSCCITENGEVVSCSFDGTVNLWKLPNDILDSHLMHSSTITSIILSSLCEYAISSDAHGNLVVWKIGRIDLPQTSPLIYAAKKSYIGGFIRKLSWMKNNCFVCAVTQVFADEEKYYFEILSFDQSSSLNIKVKKSYYFQDEILCLDSCAVTDNIVVGFKSGEILVINSDTQRLIQMCDDWILGTCLYSRNGPSDLFCATFIDGSLKLYSISDFMKAESKSEASPFADYKPLDSYDTTKLTSTLYCGTNKMICCGDVHGVLRIYSQHTLKFSEKIHADSITGICMMESYIFTSSLDRTVKGWDVNTLKQVCQFHLHIPISCLVAPKVDASHSITPTLLLLVGTISGDVHLLRFHSNK